MNKRHNFHSGFAQHQKNSRFSPLSSGNSTLDELLDGGFHRNLIYLLYGDKKKTTDILLKTAVIAQKTFVNGGFGGGIKVAFVDGYNRFNPYTVSKFAVTQHLSPTQTLENILISRAFTWDQMVEILENRLSKLDDIKVVLISGITNLFQDYEKKNFEDLLKAVDGIKKTIEKKRPLIIFTTPLNEYSFFRPKGGKILPHFGSVLVQINDTERYTEYKLTQHPYLPEKVLKKFKKRESRKNLKISTKNRKIDCWL
ncbi:MAG: hypothetical protein ACOC44_18180 [Promethearchaeia archaeon]